MHEPVEGSCPEGVKEYFQVRTGLGGHSFALDTDGNVYGWGANDKGQLGIGAMSTTETKLKKVSGTQTFWDVAGGDKHTLALALAGTARGRRGADQYTGSDTSWLGGGHGYQPSGHFVPLTSMNSQVFFAQRQQVIVRPRDGADSLVMDSTSGMRRLCRSQAANTNPRENRSRTREIMAVRVSDAIVARTAIITEDFQGTLRRFLCAFSSGQNQLDPCRQPGGWAISSNLLGVPAAGSRPTRRCSFRLLGRVDLIGRRMPARRALRPGDVHILTSILRAAAASDRETHGWR
ncbi:hypothetical protein [Nannocystis pusilla]|uniref:hypothetical protein n=1 Tax=Nannocystis pusilla TaxID=889268 RepID=UPI003BF39A2F